MVIVSEEFGLISFYLTQPKFVSESLGISMCNVMLALFNLSILLTKFLYGKDQLNIPGI